MTKTHHEKIAHLNMQKTIPCKIIFLNFESKNGGSSSASTFFWSIVTSISLRPIPKFCINLITDCFTSSFVFIWYNEYCIQLSWLFELYITSSSLKNLYASSISFTELKLAAHESNNLLGLACCIRLEVCDVASSAYLPHSGKSRLGCEAGAMMKFVFIPFVYCWRAGTC